jgi:hypothetical protein
MFPQASSGSEISILDSIVNYMKECQADERIRFLDGCGMVHAQLISQKYFPLTNSPTPDEVRQFSEYGFLLPGLVRVKFLS